MSYYTVTKLNGIENLRNIFPSGEADEFNWVFFGTGGVHDSSSIGHLDDAAQAVKNGEIATVTCIVVKPRIVVMHWGNIELSTQEDVAFIKRLAISTSKVIMITSRFFVEIF